MHIPLFCSHSCVSAITESTDSEYDDYSRRFTQIETAVEKFLKDTKLYNESVMNVFTCGHGFGLHFATLMRSNGGEVNFATKYPEAAHTIEHVDGYEVAFEELRNQVAPELELIESRVVTPVKEIQGIMKVIRKTMTKRDHKVSFIPLCEAQTPHWVQCFRAGMWRLTMSAVGRLRSAQQLVDQTARQKGKIAQ